MTQTAEPLDIDNEFTTRETVVFVFDKNLQKLHEHRYWIYDIVDFLVLLQTVVNLDEIRHLYDIDLLHQTVVLFLRVGFIELCVSGYEMNAARQFINGSPASCSDRNFFFRKNFPNVLYFADTVKINVTQAIDHHLKFFSVQVKNDFLH